MGEVCFFNYLKKSNHLPNRRGFSAIFISVPSLVFHAVVFLMTGVNWTCIWASVSPLHLSMLHCVTQLTYGFPTCRHWLQASPRHPCTPYSYGNEHAVHWDVVGENRGLRGLLCVWGCFSHHVKRTRGGLNSQGVPCLPQLFRVSLLRFCQMTELKTVCREFGCPLFKGTQSMGGAVLPHKQWWSSLPKGANPCMFRLLGQVFLSGTGWLKFVMWRPLFWESWSWWLRP